MIQIDGPLRSDKVLAHAKGQPCTLRIPKVCRGGIETTVPCHVRDKHKGMGQKSSDSSVAFGCMWCHAYLDIDHGTKPMVSDAVLLQCVIDGLLETQEILIRDGIISWPHNKPRRPKKSKPRLPRDQRAKISTGRPMTSRNNLAKGNRNG